MCTLLMGAVFCYEFGYVLIFIYLYILSVYKLGSSETLGRGLSHDEETCNMLPDTAVTQEHKSLIVINPLLLFWISVCFSNLIDWIILMKVSNCIAYAINH